MPAKDAATAAPSAPLGFGADAPVMIERVRQGMSLHQSGDFAAAVHAYQEVLARYPDHPDVNHFLGMAEYKRGDEARARQLLARSIALDGRKAIVHVNLGRIELNSGQLQVALEHFAHAAQLDPKDWEAQHMLGQALLANEQPYEAAHALELAAALRPSSRTVMLDLAQAYGSCRRHPAAVKTLRKLLAVEPDNVAALGALAFSMRAMNRTSEALSCLNRATALAPQELRWLCELGELHEELGAFDEATRLFRSALERRPGYPIAIAHLLALRKGIEDRALIEKAQAHLAAREIVKPVRVQLQFALGRHYDAAKDYDRAFEHYQAANEIVAEGRRYKPLAMESQVDRLIRAFDVKRLSTARAGGNPSERPIFVVGMPRSGTTLTEQILASHPDIAGAGELGYFNHMAYELSRKSGHGDEPASDADGLDAGTLASCAEGYLEQLAGVSAETLRVVDKMPMNFMQLGLIALTFPNARVIHCRRDPLDTCLSCYFENFHEDQRYGTRLESLGHHYRQYERLMRHWREALPLPLLEVQYEETVADVEAQARRMIAFCGLNWDDRCLDFHRTARAVNTPSRWQVRQPIYSTSVARWRRYERHLGPLQAALARSA